MKNFERLMNLHFAGKYFEKAYDYGKESFSLRYDTEEYRKVRMLQAKFFAMAYKTTKDYDKMNKALAEMVAYSK